MHGYVYMFPGLERNTFAWKRFALITSATSTRIVAYYLSWRSDIRPCGDQTAG